MSATLVTPKTTSGGEIIRELVNASDGQGLHLDGSAGGINLGASMPDLGTKYSLEFVVKGDSKSGETYLLDAYKSGARIIFGWSGYSNGNIQLHINGTWSSAFMATPDNGQVVHLVLSVDGTSATLYQNGNSVSTQTVVANTMTSATSTHIGCSQNGTANYFNGTIYRARFYNKSLTSAEVQTAYERADVDFADQYGEQNLVDAAASAFTSGIYSWTKYGNNTVANVSNNLVVTYVDNTQGAYNYLRDSSDLNQNLVLGKKYRIRITAKYAGGSAGANLQIYDGASYATIGTLTTSFAEYEAEFTCGGTGTNNLVKIDGLSASNVITIDTWQVDEIGCVSDYDLAFANPTQSLTVQDRAGAADGTASSSTAVTQVQKLVQVNATSARIGTVASAVADGTLAIGNKQADAHSDANELIIATSAGGGGMTINTANNAGGSIYFADGTSGDDLYRGYVVYNHSSNLMALGTDALTRLTIDSIGHVAIGDDKYYQWGGTNARIVGSHAGNYVKILTSNTARLVVNSAGEITQTGEGVSYTIKNSDTSLVADQLIGGVAFEKTDGSGAGAGVVGGMRMHSEGSVGESAYLAFSTASGSGNDVEAMRIDANRDITQTATTPALILKDDQSSGTWAKNDPLGSLQFHTSDTSGVGAHEIAGIHTETDEAGTNTQVAGAMVFKTAAYNNATPEERLRIDSSGNITQLGGSPEYHFGTTSASHYNWRIACQETIDGAFEIASGTTSAGSGAASDTYTTRFHIDAATGLSTFNNGINLGDTTLSNYAQGTWSPVFAGDSTAGTYTSSSTATYTRIGNQVTVYCSLVNITETSAGSGSIKISGLPFASASGGQGYTAISRVRQYSSAVGPFYALVSPTASYVNLMYYVNGSTDAPAPISGLSSGNTDITFTLTYFV